MTHETVVRTAQGANRRQEERSHMEPPDFYTDKEKRTIKPDLFSECAERWAKKLPDQRLNRRSQIRKFYDEILRLNSLVKRDQRDWDGILPYVNMLIAKVTYAWGRDLVSDDFVNLMRKCVEQVKTPEDLEVFATFFEAFMGFYRKYGKD